MKTVLLLGDSIRQNYETVVKNLLSDKANVLFTNDNNRFGAYTLRYASDWIRALTGGQNNIIDVIHLNFGLWDVIRLSNEDTTFTSLAGYHSILERVIRRLQFLCPDSIILLANTTCVIGEGLDPQAGVGIRRNSDIELFNREIESVSREFFLPPPNDLYGVSVSMPDECRSDCVHFDTEAGRKMLGQAVADYIERFL